MTVIEILLEFEGRDPRLENILKKFPFFTIKPHFQLRTIRGVQITTRGRKIFKKSTSGGAFIRHSGVGEIKLCNKAQKYSTEIAGGVEIDP